MSDRQEDDSQQTRQSQPQPLDVNCESNESQEVGDAKRVLRKRKVDLNRLASSISCPMVCKFQHCGVQLADYAALEVTIFDTIILFFNRLCKKINSSYK